MTAILAGLLSGWLVLRLTGFKRDWPWRIAEFSDLPLCRQRVYSSAGAATPAVPSGGPRSGAVYEPRTVPTSPFRARKATGRRFQTSSSVEVQKALPLAADLLLVAVSAGHSIHGAIEVVGRVGDGPVSYALGAAWKRFCDGARLVDELRELPHGLGEQVRPLCNTLVMGLTSGAPLEPALHRLADRERRRLRRRTEERVRRLPILLLAPLVLLVLPSFVLLAIVPVILATARNAGF